MTDLIWKTLQKYKALFLVFQFFFHHFFRLFFCVFFLLILFHLIFYLRHAICNKPRSPLVARHFNGFSYVLFHSFISFFFFLWFPLKKIFLVFRCMSGCRVLTTERSALLYKHTHTHISIHGIHIHAYTLLNIRFFTDYFLLFWYISCMDVDIFRKIIYYDLKKLMIACACYWAFILFIR